VRRINEFVIRLEEVELRLEDGGSLETQLVMLVSDVRTKYVSALEEDLDTPKALATVFGLITEGNRMLDLGASSRRGVEAMLEFMKKDFDSIFAVLRSGQGGSLSEDESALLKERETARLSKDWAKSDELRKKLLALGIDVQDTPSGQKWRRKSKIE
jgi:cysteinyl-tRNA synthetase